MQCGSSDGNARQDSWRFHIRYLSPSSPHIQPHASPATHPQRCPPTHLALCPLHLLKVVLGHSRICRGKAGRAAQQAEQGRGSASQGRGEAGSKREEGHRSEQPGIQIEPQQQARHQQGRGKRHSIACLQSPGQPPDCRTMTISGGPLPPPHPPTPSNHPPEELPASSSARSGRRRESEGRGLMPSAQLFRVWAKVVKL